jgi:hypothetical protein
VTALRFSPGEIHEQLASSNEKTRAALPTQGLRQVRLAGHQPLAMFGATRDYVHMRCDYGRQYGRAEAAALPIHGQWCSIREATLLPLILDFFEQRIFGATRLDLLAEQLDMQPSGDPDEESGTRLTRQIADADAAIAAQVRGLEAGVEAAEVRG